MPAIPIQNRLNFFLNAVRTGMSPTKANRFTRQQLGMGIRNQTALQIGNAFNLELQRTANEITGLRPSDRLRTRNATRVPFISRMRHKYEARFTFQILDKDTGKVTEIERTIGFKKLPLKRELDSAMLDRAIAFSQAFSSSPIEILTQTIKLKDFVQMKR